MDPATGDVLFIDTVNPSSELDSVQPDHVFDGGDMDCGSGLILLIRQNLLSVPVGGVMEMRSREPTVAEELPPWCRMTGHAFLGALPGEGFQRYFLRRGEPDMREEAQLEEDKAKAKEYVWRLRARAQARQTVSVYCRNFSWKIGQPASFEEKDREPSAVESLMGSLAADLCSGFATLASRRGLEIDDLEIALQARLGNILAHLGLEEGDPALDRIDLVCYASSFDDPEAVRQVWEDCLRRAPVFQTLNKAVTIGVRLSLV